MQEKQGKNKTVAILCGIVYTGLAKIKKLYGASDKYATQYNMMRAAAYDIVGAMLTNDMSIRFLRRSISAGKQSESST